MKNWIISSRFASAASCRSERLATILSKNRYAFRSGLQVRLGPLLVLLAIASPVQAGAPDGELAVGFDRAGAVLTQVEPGNPWTELQKLNAEEGGEGELFGGAVAIDGNVLLVGAESGGALNQGVVHVYERVAGVWIQAATLSASDGVGGDQFGNAIALQGNTALIGARFADQGGSESQGAAYVFMRENDIWSQQAKLIAVDGVQFDQFGHSVGLSSNLAIVGAISADLGDEINQGAAYVFVRAETGWSQQAKLMASDGTSGDLFGASVGISGNTALVGAIQATVGDVFQKGAVYAFTSSGDVWTEQQKFTSSGFSQAFGASVSLHSERALIGAPFEGLAEDFLRGAAYVFERTGTSWVERARLTGQDGTDLDMFGSAVAIRGNTALVGAPNFDIEANEFQGAAHLFVRDGDLWAETNRLTASDGQSFDRFGTAVALDFDQALIGAPSAVVNENVDQGAAYVFVADNGLAPPAPGPRPVPVPTLSGLTLVLLVTVIFALALVRLRSTSLLAVSALTVVAGSIHASEPLLPLGESDIVIRVWQDEIRAEVRDTNPMHAGGGLVGELVASSLDRRSNRKSREEMVAIRERLGGYPVGRVFADMLLSDVRWESIASGPVAAVESGIVNLEELPPVSRPRLEVVPEVVFTTNMNTLVVRVDTILITPSTRPNEKNKLTRLGHYEFAWPVTHLRKELKTEDASRKWLALTREELIELVESGMNTTITLWNFHLDNPDLPKGSGSWNPLYTPVIQYGKKIDQHGDMVWLKRSGNSDWLYAVHRHVFWAKVPAE